MALGCMVDEMAAQTIGAEVNGVEGAAQLHLVALGVDLEATAPFCFCGRSRRCWLFSPFSLNKGSRNLLSLLTIPLSSEAPLSGP